MIISFNGIIINDSPTINLPLVITLTNHRIVEKQLAQFDFDDSSFISSQLSFAVFDLDDNC